MELSGPRRRPAPREAFGNPEVAELAYGSSDDPPGHDDDDLPDESSQSGEAQAARARGDAIPPRAKEGGPRETFAEQIKRKHGEG